MLCKMKINDGVLERDIDYKDLQIIDDYEDI